MIGLSLFVKERLLGTARAGPMIAALLGELPDSIPKELSYPPSARLRKVKAIEDLYDATQSSGGSGRECLLLQAPESADMPSISITNFDKYCQFSVEFADKVFLDEAKREQILELALALAAQAGTESGSINDVTDFSLQNETNPAVVHAAGKSLKGYRLKLWSWKREIDTEKSPGHWHFIDGLLFAVSWVNYYGPRMIELLGESRILNAPWAAVRQRDGLIEGRLYDDPFKPEESKKRKLQALVRKELRLDEVAHDLMNSGH